jgi:hypothetical protein
MNQSDLPSGMSRLFPNSRNIQGIPMVKFVFIRTDGKKKFLAEIDMFYMQTVYTECKKYMLQRSVVDRWV